MSDGIEDVGRRTDFLWKTIARIDTYIGTTNAKASLFVALDTFLVGALVLKSSDYLNLLGVASHLRTVGALAILATALLSLASLALALFVVQPYLTSNKRPGDYHSRIFFCDVAEVNDPLRYLSHVRGVDADAMLDDLAQQVHAVAVIASRKFASLRRVARIAVFGQCPVMLVMLALPLLSATNEAKNVSTVQGAP